MKTVADKHLDIADHKTAWHWLDKTARADPEGFVRLTGDNTKRLKVLFGDSQWKATEGKDWTDGWLIAKFGLNFFITTGKHSTKYYIRVPTDGEDYLADPRVGVGIVEFLTEMLRQLRTHY